MKDHSKADHTGTGGKATGLVTRNLEMVRESALAVGLSVEECQEVARLIQVRTLADGEYIQEDPGKNFLYSIFNGTLSVEIDQSGGHFSLHMLCSGDLAGEFGFLEDIERTARLKALGETEIFCLERNAYERLNAQFPAIGFKIMRNIVRSIRQSLVRMNMQNLDFLNYIKSHL